MKIVHVGYYYGTNNTGGAAIAATRIHRALRINGVDSYFLCVHNRSDETENVEVIPSSKSIKRLWVIFATKILRNIWRLTCHKTSRVLNLIPTGMLQAIKVLAPDIVHIHWVSADAISFGEISKIPCPVVIHLHDMWMINGFDPYPHKDRRYIDGFYNNNTSWLERNLVRRKRGAIISAKAVFAAPSIWVASECRKSVIASGCECYHVPYFPDPVFSFDPALRKKHGKFTILFGAFQGRRNPVKGFSDLESAILMLPRDIQEKIDLFVFGECHEDCAIGSVRVHFLGVVSDSYQLKEIYHQADIFAFPSHEETQGQTKLEAMLCGLPAIAFDRTACAEGIFDGETGRVLPDGDIAGFADAILFYYREHSSQKMDDDYRYIISRKTKSLYDCKVIVSKYISMYGQIQNRVQRMENHI